jgi:hypothetical protein
LNFVFAGSVFAGSAVSESAISNSELLFDRSCISAPESKSESEKSKEILKFLSESILK